MSRHIPQSPVVRLFARTDFDGGPPEFAPQMGSCWIYQGYKELGYGKIQETRGKMKLTHRVSYEYLIGAVPQGLQLDHLCRNRACCNPFHLEPVTSRENCLRGLSPSAKNASKTHCKRGHEFTEENTIIDHAGGRQCKICTKERRVAWEKRTKEHRRLLAQRPHIKEAARARAAKWYAENKERALESSRLYKLRTRKQKATTDHV